MSMDAPIPTRVVVPDALVDLLLPGTDSLPSGVSVGANGSLLEDALAADPRLREPLAAVVERAAANAPSTLVDLLELAGEQAEEFAFALSAAYYMSSQVREVLGYPGQQRRPIATATADEIVSEDLVAPVIARGAVYVPTP